MDDKRFAIVAKQMIENPKKTLGITVVRDNNTQKEYMIVCAYEGVAIQPLNKGD